MRPPPPAGILAWSSLEISGPRRRALLRDQVLVCPFACRDGVPLRLLQSERCCSNEKRPQHRARGFGPEWSSRVCFVAGHGTNTYVTSRYFRPPPRRVRWKMIARRVLLWLPGNGGDRATGESNCQRARELFVFERWFFSLIDRKGFLSQFGRKMSETKNDRRFSRCFGRMIEVFQRKKKHAKLLSSQKCFLFWEFNSGSLISKKKHKLQKTNGFVSACSFVKKAMTLKTPKVRFSTFLQRFFIKLSSQFQISLKVPFSLPLSENLLLP